MIHFFVFVSTLSLNFRLHESERPLGASVEQNAQTARSFVAFKTTRRVSRRGTHGELQVYCSQP